MGLLAVLTDVARPLREETRLEQFLANGFCKGAIIALVALGFGLIYTTTRVFHIAHASIYVLSAYALYAAVVRLRFPLPVALVLGVLVAIITGVLVDWSVYQPLAKRSASAAVVLISSLGVQIVIDNLIAICFGNQTQILRVGVERTLSFGSIILTQVQIAQAIVGIVLTGVFWLFLKHSRTGQHCRAVSDDETLASVLGLRVNHIRLVAFGLGSAFAAIGSILVALDVGMDPHVGLSVVLTAAVACIIGGLRNFLAPAVGGVLLGLTQSLVVWRTSAKWEEAVTFGILILFLLFRRRGLFGVIRRAEETP
jgi:branched-chain amino acid transport system permease protein